MYKYDDPKDIQYQVKRLRSVYNLLLEHYYVMLRHTDLIRDEIRVISLHAESKKIQF